MRPFVQRRFWPLRVRKSDDLCRVNSRNERPDGDALRFSLHKVNCCLSPLSYWLLSPGFFLSLFIKMWFSAQCFPAVIDNRSWRKSSQRRNPLVKRAFSHLACRTGQLPGSAAVCISVSLIHRAPQLRTVFVTCPPKQTWTSWHVWLFMKVELWEV